MKLGLLLALSVLFACLTALPAAERHPRQVGRVGRSVTLATNGMVATSHPLAAQIGLDVLKAGGNAIDAAIATNAALGLMEPMSCGIGGDLFAIVWDAKTKKLHGLNASGRAPKKATREFFARKGMREIPTTGPLSWSVPGCVDGWDVLNRQFGSMPLGKLLEPSIRYAEAGFPVTEVIAGYWAAAASKLAADPDAGKTYRINEQVPRAGELFKNPNLGRSYRAIAEGGRDAFYKGKLAQAMVAFSERHEGLFGLDDFTGHTSTAVEPVSTNYRGHDVFALPPPGQGIAVLQMLNVLEGYDLKKMGPNSTDFWHTFVEAKKLAYADRAKFYADPDFEKLPVAELISKPYAEKRRALLDPLKANHDLPAGDPKLGKADTVYLTVVDKDRNCVSLIQSNYFGFGSGMVPGDLGFVLQNRGTLFALDEKHLNRLEPGKRPFHTIIPAMVLRDGRPCFCFGVMGGDMQPQGQVQVLVNLIDFGMNVQAAGEAPRVEHVGSATPTGTPAHADGGTIRAEPGVTDAVLAELTRRGHKVERVAVNGGGYQGIWIDAAGVLHGGTEARKDGAAVGY